MPQYLAPGVYVEEIEVGPVPIEGVSTNTAAFLGETERGPVKPRLITSYNDYLRLFGQAAGPGKFMPNAVSSFFDNGGRRVYIARIVGAGGKAAQADFGGVTVSAVGPGVAGNNTVMFVQDANSKAVAGTPPKAVNLAVGYWSGQVPDANTLTDAMNPFVAPSTPKDRYQGPAPALIERFNDIDITNAASPNFWSKRLSADSGASALVAFGLPNTVQTVDPTQVTLGKLVPLANGVDGGAVDNVAYVGAAPTQDQLTGLSALTLDQYRDVALVYAPAALDDVVDKVKTHCEDQRFRFAIIDCKPNVGDITQLDPRGAGETSYAAFYYPWVTVADPVTGAATSIPPGGAVAGIYSRSDDARGVYKAPANEVVLGALNLEFLVDQGTQEVLNPLGVNCIRHFPGRGILVWGARTLSSDALWKYVSVRRLLIFLEHSIYDGTQWVVFEPNDERLWARVKDTIRLFLRTQWREGALMGTTEDEAFRIACDRTTMTQDDILNGRLICEVGVAPVRPAEFVIFRLYQITQAPQS